MGFVSRWYLPHIQFEFANFEYPVSLTLIIVDQLKENYVDIGYDWSPIRLEQGEIMVQQLVLDYIGGSIGDQVTFPLDFSSFLGDQSLAKLFALMVLEVDGMYVDLDTMNLKYDYGNQTVPLSAFGIDGPDAILNLNLTVK